MKEKSSTEEPLISASVGARVILREILKLFLVALLNSIMAISLFSYLFTKCNTTLFAYEDKVNIVTLDKNIQYGETGKKLDTYLKKLVNFGFSGAVLVSIDGKIILNKGYGYANKENRTINTAATIFSLGSLTKQFTAAAILKLEMMGKLSTNDSISKYFPNIPPDKKNITIHHLLTHTSGLISGMGSGYTPNRDEEVKYILSQPLSFSPGTDFMYSNEGYTLLAAIIEIASGLEYEKYLKEYLFLPAGMYFTGYHSNYWKNNNIAINYANEINNGSFVEIHKHEYPNWKLIGNGGICSTTSDMYRWYIALQNDKVLSEEAKKKMFSPFLNDYGYGWDIIKRGDVGLLIQHNGGSTLGNAAEMRMYINKNIVSITFSNNDGVKILINQLRDKIESIIFGKEINISVTTLDYDIIKNQKYAGKYVLQKSEYSGFIIETGKDFLKFMPFGQDTLNILYSYAPEEAKLNILLNKKSYLIAKGALNDNYSELQSLFKEQERFARFKKAFNKVITEHSLKNANIEIIGTVKYSPYNKSRATLLRFSKEDEILKLALIWNHKKLIGLEIIEPNYSIEIPFVPASNIKYVGYDIKLEKMFTLFFAEDLNGKVIGAQMNGKTFKKED